MIKVTSNLWHKFIELTLPCTKNGTFFVMFCFFFIAACSDSNEIKQSALNRIGDIDSQFNNPSKEYVIRLPKDHAPHLTFQQEWWYLTANLVTESGESLATQWTLFRRAVEDKHWYFAHAALADANKHASAFRTARPELGNVQVETQPFRATIDNWRWHSSSTLLPATLSYGNFIDVALPENMQKNDEIISENNNNIWQVNLELSNDSLSVDNQPQFYLQGEKGFSQKHHQLDIASHYYSQPFINVSGEVFWQNKWQKVTGSAWFDREWGSQMLAADQQGWDWFSLRLDDNTALMVYQIRSIDKDYLYGSIMRRDGSIITLSSEDISLVNMDENHEEKGSAYPEKFAIEIARENINVEVNVINNNQIMRFGIEYFEGMVQFKGSHSGQGFLEMTGYTH